MIDGLKPYPEYMESGLQWLGPIPSHWKLLRSKYLFREVDERSVTGRETRLSMSQQHGLIPSSRMEAHRLVSESQVGAKICEPGYLVLNRLKAHLGVFALASQRGLVSPDYTVLRPTRDFEARYFEAFYRTPECRVELYRRAKGIVEGFWRLYTDDFNDIRVPMPDREEQATMLKFLDYANGRIERVTRTKKKLIALLHEQKKAIIHSAVTRGLDPQVPLKPSGIPWLHDIPKHWEVRRLSSVAEFLPGKAHEQFFDPSGRYICVNARFVSTGGDSRKFCTQNFSPALKGDVLMVMSDLPNGRALARAFFVNDDGPYAVNQRVCIIRAYGMNSKFLAYFANRNQALLRHDDGSNQTHLSNGDFKTMPLLCPPRGEQDAIVRMLDKETAEIDIVAHAAEREIDLLREYRTRLIADVVTGKLDVRAAVRNLSTRPEAPAMLVPDEIDEAELIEEEQPA
jgi:type I restriction enzyme S subunit